MIPRQKTIIPTNRFLTRALSHVLAASERVRTSDPVQRKLHYQPHLLNIKYYLTEDRAESEYADYKT
jgi:hypothetical protein